MDSNVKIFLGVVGVLILGTVATVIIRSNGNSIQVAPGKYDSFAQCLKDKGAIFYGAWWCPHCKTQKNLFGSAAKFLPYVECSNANGDAQTKICIDKKITSYPTWELADGSRLNGEIPLAQLAEKTSCPLRQSSSEASELPK